MAFPQEVLNSAPVSAANLAHRIAEAEHLGRSAAACERAAQRGGAEAAIAAAEADRLRRAQAFLLSLIAGERRAA